MVELIEILKLYSKYKDIKEGYINNRTGKIVIPTKNDDYYEYHMLTPEDVVKHNIGTNYDISNLLLYELDKKGIGAKSLDICIIDSKDRIVNARSCVVVDKYIIDCTRTETSGVYYTNDLKIFIDYIMCVSYSGKYHVMVREYDYIQSKMFYNIPWFKFNDKMYIDNRKMIYNYTRVFTKEYIASNIKDKLLKSVPPDVAMYHGSKNKFKELTTHNSYSHPEFGKIAFASPNKQMATVFSTDWRDDVMKLSSDHKNNKNKPLVFSVYMIGDIDYMSPAYVHEIKNDGKWFNIIGRTEECIRMESAKVIKTTEYKTYQDALIKNGIKVFDYKTKRRYKNIHEWSNRIKD